MNSRNNAHLPVTIFICLLAAGNAAGQQRAGGKTASMVMATYNIRYANPGDSANGNGWGQRLPVIAQLIRFYDFDIFGTQEGLYHQLQGLKDSLPGYAYTGVGRDDGKQAGEYSAIFYKVNKFHLLEKGDSGYQPSPIPPIKVGMRHCPASVPGGNLK